MQSTHFPPRDSRPIDPKLRNGRVLIVGVGGLGCPAALQLAAVGIGTLGLMDGDVVEISNLQRQILFRTADIGRSKASAAAERLAQLYPETAVRVLDHRLDGSNLREVFAGYDFVIDGTDHVETKFLINDGALACRVAYSHAGVIGFRGQTLTVVPERSACLRCVFPLPPAEDDLPTCQTAGVLGALAGVIGSIQAGEAVKYLLGLDGLLQDRLLVVDAWSQRWRTVRISTSCRSHACRS